MSARRHRIVLTKRAQRDSRNIHLYTRRQWGAEQAKVYDAAIDQVLETLVDNPRIGRARPDIHPSLLSFPVEHHILFYRVKGNIIEIVRILHERADPARHLP